MFFFQGFPMEDQDAELFLILPRLVLLSGLWESSHCALARNFGMEGWQWEALSNLDRLDPRNLMESVIAWSLV